MAHRRVLRVVQADVVQPVGDEGFAISIYLLGGIFDQDGNVQRSYVTGTVVTATDADELADAIEKIEETQKSRMAMAMNGDTTGEGVKAFWAWLRRGGFEIVEGHENVEGR